MALSTNDTVIYDANAPCGFRFMNHAANSTTIHKIYARTWDYVVLQVQSQEPSWPEFDLIKEVNP